MKTTLRATVSASVIALSLPLAAPAQGQSQGGANGQGAGQLLNATPAELVEGRTAGQITDAFTALATFCERGARTPAQMDCALIERIASDPALAQRLADEPEVLSELMGQPAPEEAAEAPAPAEEPAAEAEPVAEAPAAEAEPAAEAPAAEAEPEPAAEDAAPAEVVEAPRARGTGAEDAPANQGGAAGQLSEALDAAEAGDVDGLRDQLSQALDPEADPAQQAEADPTPVQDAPRQTAEEQAEAVAERDTAAANSAAARDPEGDAEMVEETVAEDDVRRSSEDFRTELSGKRKDEGDDDNDALRKFGTAALVGLGAVALNEILSEDEEVVSNSGDRIVVQQGDGSYRVLRNDDVLLRRPGAEVQTQRYDDGSTRTVIAYDDGSKVETIRASDGRVLRRTRILQDGSEVVLFDDTQAQQEVVVNDLPQATDQRTVDYRRVQAEDLAAALAAQQTGVDRRFSLNQVRNIDAVRQLVPALSVDTINFETNSAAIRPQEAEELAALGNAMRDLIDRNPAEVFLIEGHTDAVGQYSYNLALSDRRAESVALALTEYFQVPPENMVLQGYGESDLLVQTPEAERANRRAAVRRITPLLNGG